MNGLAPATRKTYRTPQRLFAEFASQHQLTDVLPPAEDTVCFWMGWLALRPVRYTTIRTYLSALRSLCIDLGYNNPIQGPRIQRVFRGIKKDQGANSGLPPKFPITFDILRRIQQYINHDSAEDRLIWAAITTAVAGLFRIGELTSSALTTSEPHRILRMANLTWHGTHFDIKLSASKTDPFREEVTQSVFHRIAVRAMANYLYRRSTPITPGSYLFSRDDGRPLSRAHLLASTKALLGKAQIDISKHYGLSFRRGGATSLATAGVEDRLIKVIGRWHSAAFEVYIDNHTDQLKRMMAQI